MTVVSGRAFWSVTPSANSISEMLKAGQDVVIQIARNLWEKGARITSHVALPAVFWSTCHGFITPGVSRKIISADNARSLRRLVSEAGRRLSRRFIVRTAAGAALPTTKFVPTSSSWHDWNEIKERSEQRKAPSLLHRDLNLVERILRDYVMRRLTGIWIGQREEYGRSSSS